MVERGGSHPNQDVGRSAELRVCEICSDGQVLEAPVRGQRQCFQSVVLWRAGIYWLKLSADRRH
jgi:hypothetical protein